MIDLRDGAPENPFDEALPYLPLLRQALLALYPHALEIKPKLTSVSDVIVFPDGTRGTLEITFSPSPVD